MRIGLNRLLILPLQSAVLALACGVVSAQPITLVPDTINMFRDTRGAGDVGIPAGDLFQFGANVSGGSAGVSVGASYGSLTVSQFGCSPLAVNPNFCARTTSFNAGRLDPWTIRFTRGPDALELLGPSLAGAEQAVPFPVSVSLSGSGLTPTISWVVPNGFAPDAFRINVFDKGRILSNGQADVVHSVAIPANATSYVLPSTFNSGLPLQAGGNYTVNLQLIETRNHVAFTNNNAEILRRSNSFFAFTPLSGNVPPAVALPTVINGVYNFNVQNVGPNGTTFIDPFVAVGYDYAIGKGDPKFKSVVLPDVGDGKFKLEYIDSGGLAQVADVDDGTQFFFGVDGVGAFRVTGIETSAMLDPANATAFITGLTFVSNGDFTGTMTPITQFVADVPEPSTWMLMLAGLLGLAQLRARQHRTRGASLRPG